MTGDSVAGGPCGTRVSRYEVERLLGGGGFGRVYRARHVHVGQPCAIKLLKPEVAQNADLLARFLREAQVAGTIKSPHVVSVTDFGTSDTGQPFLVMELIEGRDLERAIAREAPFDVGRAVAIAVEILEGLGAVHAAGIVHRDVKPANVLLTQNASGRETVKIVDFGISKAAEAIGIATQTGAMLGTPHYIPPEQFRSATSVDARADVYATGVILYRMLSGVFPFDAATYEELIVRVYTEPLKPLRFVAPSVPVAIARVVERALARDREERWPSAAELAGALTTALGSSGRPEPALAADSVAIAPTNPSMPAVTPDATIEDPVRLPVRRAGRVVAVLVAGLLAAGAAAVGVAIVLSSAGSEDPPSGPVATQPQRPPDVLPATASVDGGAAASATPAELDASVAQLLGLLPAFAEAAEALGGESEARDPGDQSPVDEALRRAFEDVIVAPELRGSGTAVYATNISIRGPSQGGPALVMSRLRAGLRHLEGCRPAGGRTVTFSMSFIGAVNLRQWSLFPAEGSSVDSPEARCVRERVEKVELPHSTTPDDALGVGFVLVLPPR